MRITRFLTAISAAAFGVLFIDTANAQFVISQIYPRGGSNIAATYNYDCIELFNNGGSSVNLSGFSVQYSSATSSAVSGSTALTGTIAGKGFHLIQTGTAGTAGGPAPVTPDQVGGSLNLSATAGKVFLANTTVAATFGVGANFGGASSSNMVDAIGYGATANAYEGATGPAPALATGNAQPLSRSSTGIGVSRIFTDTNNNANDFTAGTPSLRSGNVVTAVPEANTLGLLIAVLPLVGGVIVARRRK